MRSRLSKQSSLALFCYCAQARGSIDHVLSSPQQWLEFLAFYDHQKRNAISNLIEMLRESGACDNNGICRHSFSRNWFSQTIADVKGRLFNRMKKSWSFSSKEMSFICSTLKHLLRILQSTEPPETQELIDLRMDFHACQWIIDGKMIGIPELRQAERVEHFNQPETAEAVTLKEIGVHSQIF